MVGIISVAAGGMGRAAASGIATTAPGYDPSIIATITSASIIETSSGCAVPTVVDAMGVADSSARPDVCGGIASITGCVATSKGAPLALPTT